MNGENTCYKQSVTAVVIRAGKVLLARHTYGAGKNMLIVPGGYLNKGETPEHAVKREYLEETGVLINPKDIIAVDLILKIGMWLFQLIMSAGRNIRITMKTVKSFGLMWMLPLKEMMYRNLPRSL